MNNITYIYAGNRKDNILNETYEAKEFYYGLHSFDSKKFNINIIELNNHTGYLNSILKIIDYIFQRFFSLPFYFSKITTYKNLKILKKSNYVIMVNESVGCSMLMLLIYLKLFTNVKTSLFIMGLYSKNVRFKFLKGLHNLAVKFVVFFIDNLFFLGKGEFQNAIHFHKKNSKLIYFPFGIDTEFWSTLDSEKNVNKINDVIFVGNDGNRDFNTLLNIVKNMPQLNFIIVSESEILNKTKLPNLKIYKGSWGAEILTDLELKNLYNSSKLTIIPLKNTTQPSGQSVALQSMAVGTPVMISKTEGFWDYEEFSDFENIFFVNNNETSLWTEKIEKVLRDNDLLFDVSIKAKEKVLVKFNLDTFYNKLNNHIFI